MKLLPSIILPSLIALSTLLVVPSALSATSEVTWSDYDKYQDIRSTDGGAKQFREIVFFNLEKHFTELAAKLPEGQKLTIKVTDLDLAGSTHISGSRDLRVVKRGYPPQMSFSYNLLDEKGVLIKSDDVKLRDANFMTVTKLKYKHDSFGYEKKMLDDWFKDTF